MPPNTDRSRRRRQDIAWGSSSPTSCASQCSPSACGLVYSDDVDDPAGAVDRHLLDQLRDRHAAIPPTRSSSDLGQSRHGPQLCRTPAGAHAPTASSSPQPCSRSCRRPTPNLAGPDHEARDLRRRLRPGGPLPPAADHRCRHRQHGRLQPGAEAGIQLGWDDEQVTIWLDRSGRPAARPGEPTQRPIRKRRSACSATASMCATERRRPPGNPLCAVTGSLPFSGATATGTDDSDAPSGELFVTPAPMRAPPTVAEAAQRSGLAAALFHGVARREPR